MARPVVTSPLGAMPVAVTTGRAQQVRRLDAKLDPPLLDRHAVMGGVRLTDPLEQHLLGASMIEQLTVDDLPQRTPAVWAQPDPLDRISDKLYIHIDVDGLDPIIARMTSTLRVVTSGLAIAAAVTLLSVRPTAHDSDGAFATRARAPATPSVQALNGTPIFEVDPTWPTTPPEWTWGQVIGIFADTRSHVWTSNRSRISEWDAQGTLLQSWDARGPNGNWSTIHGLFVDHNGFVWTNARESHVTVKFTRTGQVAMVIGKFNETGGSNDTTSMGRPSEIWVDAADNEVFVADGYGNRRVIVFDGATGKYLRHWGAYGKQPIDPPRPPPGAPDPGAPPVSPTTAEPAPPAQFRIPHGIVGSRDGLIYLADRGNNRVQVFRQNGEFVREKILRPLCGAQEKATWVPKRPCGVEAAFSVGLSHDAPQSYLYVADGGTHVITVLRRSDLAVVDEFAGPGVAPGQLGRPHNLTVDPSGNIFVAEAAGPKVKHPTTGAEVDAGSRAQKFAFKGTRAR